LNLRQTDGKPEACMLHPATNRDVRRMESSMYGRNNDIVYFTNPCSKMSRIIAIPVT